MKRCQTPAWISCVLIGAALTTVASGQGLSQLGHTANAEQSGGGILQAIWRPDDRNDRAVRFSDYVNAHGETVVVPAGYCGPGHGGPGYGAGQPCGPSTGCGPGCGPLGAAHNNPGCHCGPVMPAPRVCGPVGPGVYGPYPPAGTSPPFGYNDDMADLMDAGLFGIDQCGPHYFDLRGEAVYMTRDETFGQNVDFTIDDIDPDDILLSSDDLDYDAQPGFRIIARYDIGPLSVVEAGYTGVFDWTASAAAVDEEFNVNTNEGDLFSLFSGVFVNGVFNPPEIVNEGGPNAQTERSRIQSISMESDLQTAEVSYRRYWVGYSTKISGTFLAGARFTRLGESFLFHTEGSQSLDYSVDARNDLFGFQTGGDMWISLVQGVRFGSEVKVGIYNNRFKLDTAINASVPDDLIDPNLRENFRGDNVAFIGEASLDLVIDLLPNWSLRGGYEVLFLDSLVLAGDNFNTGKIYDNQPLLPDRVPFLNRGGSALYHGAHLGAEYIW